MASESHGKRPADDSYAELEAKKRRQTEIESTDLLALCKLISAELEGTCSKLNIKEKLQELILKLEDVSYGYRSSDCKVVLKRQLLQLLAPLAKAINKTESPRQGGDLESELVEVLSQFVDCLVRNGFAQSSRDRRDIIASGAWLMCMEALSGESDDVLAAVHVYLHLSDYVSFYDDFIGMHPEFWHPRVFQQILKHVPKILHLPDTLQADEWELRCPDIEAAVKCFFCFLLFWTAKEPEEKFTFEISEAFPLLHAALDALETFDAKFGSEIGAKSRGDPLEELIRTLGLLTQLVVEKIDSHPETNEESEMQKLQEHAAAILKLLVQLLKLKIPTYGAKPEAIADGPIPVDERQQDSEWIQNLLERLPDGEPAVSAACLMDVFRATVDMTLDEQRYRLECLSPMVPRFIAGFVDQLRQKTVPPELADFKIVMNSVLQECATSFALELLEEVSFYPCLLDFTTKRAMLHAQCDRVKLTQGSDPIRIVVPRDNVLDGVCSTLNLQDAQARIDVPLEIEFRAGYSDDTGNELVDEGEDQGGPRRQWLERACRYSTDLWCSFRPLAPLV